MTDVISTLKIQAMGNTQSCNVKDVVNEPLVELWNVDTQFARVGKFVNHPTNLLTVALNDTLKNLLKQHCLSVLS